jgi:hypothetical protein
MITTYINKKEFANSLNQYANQKESLIQKLKEFVKHKEQYPSNGNISSDMPGFGGDDKKFKSDNHFGISVRNIAHAHLTLDISVVYLVDGDKLYIYGVYNHDSIGIGQPRNANRQKQAAARWKNLNFDDTFSTDELASSKKEKTADLAKPTGTKPDFTPKAKVAPQSTKPASTGNSVVELVQKVDKHWPQRGLLNKLSGAQTKQQAISIINSEAQNIVGLQQRGAKLYPNQMDYFRGLESLYAHYEKQR